MVNCWRVIGRLVPDSWHELRAACLTFAPISKISHLILPLHHSCCLLWNCVEWSHQLVLLGDKCVEQFFSAVVGGVGGCRVIGADIHFYPPGKAANVENAWPWFSTVGWWRHRETTWTGGLKLRGARPSITPPGQITAEPGLVARSQPGGPEGGEPMGPRANS